MRRAVSRFAVVLAALITFAPATAAARESLPRPQLHGKAAIVVDAPSGEVLLEQNADRRRAIASTTKLMTALLALERANLNDVFTAPEYDALPVESKINLRKGERMTVHDLLKALLLESANDAAQTIAVNLSGSRRAFVREMNARARELGLSETRYSNPVGLDDPGNYSSARDLAALARRLLRNRTFARIVNMPSATLTSGSHRRTVNNRNLLVRRFPFVDGVKTGHTRTAGYVLIGSATGRNRQAITVVLGEPSEAARDNDSVALLRWGIDQYVRRPIVREGRTLAEADVKWRDEKVKLAAAGAVTLTVRRGEKVARRISAPDELEGPLDAGERVGTVSVVHDGDVVRSVPLVTAEEVPGAGPLRRLSSALGVVLSLLLLLTILFGVALVGLRVRAVRARRGRTMAR
jgi:serine-type D-Ala-D-Ala carboxypeptidase (penicillin-binding protein 5/6)